MLVKSEAVLAILDRLGGLWRVAAVVARVLPRVVRDVMYDGVAKVRGRVFARPKDVCPMVAEGLRRRFR